MLNLNQSQSLANFQALWNKVAKGHLPQLGQGMNLLADGLTISAVVVTGMKVAAIVQLGILAAEIIADQAAPHSRSALPRPRFPVETEVTSQIVDQIIKQAVNQVEQQLIQAVEGPIFNALDSAASEMAGQLLGDALGTHSGLGPQRGRFGRVVRFRPGRTEFRTAARQHGRHRWRPACCRTASQQA